MRRTRKRYVPTVPRVPAGFEFLHDGPASTCQPREKYGTSVASDSTRAHVASCPHSTASYGSSNRPTGAEDFVVYTTMFSQTRSAFTFKYLTAYISSRSPNLLDYGWVSFYDCATRQCVGPRKMSGVAPLNDPWPTAVEGAGDDWTINLDNANYSGVPCQMTANPTYPTLHLTTQKIYVAYHLNGVAPANGPALSGPTGMAGWTRYWDFSGLTAPPSTAVDIGGVIRYADIPAGPDKPANTFADETPAWLPAATSHAAGGYFYTSFSQSPGKFT